MTHSLEHLPMQPTLLVLAAGMGSRFGGLKQMEPVGPSGEWILDYSVYDAIAAGFGSVVFVIRPEMEKQFRELTESKYGSHIRVAYAFQTPHDIPTDLGNLDYREKPWGTGHAVYAARNELDSPFAVINADDFYGREAFEVLHRFLTKGQNHGREFETYGLVGYELANTLSRNGSVSRGVCAVDSENRLISIQEHTDIRRDTDGTIAGKRPDGTTAHLAPETPVSLNCWGFPANWAQKLEPLFKRFLEEKGKEPRSEFYLPSAVDTLVTQNVALCEALPCSARWLGITHRADLEEAKNAIASQIAENRYPTSLF